MSRNRVTAEFNPTPRDLAVAFWTMDACEQADFFAELERMAGVKLCFQMAGVVDVIHERTEAGDYDAMHGFQTMLHHASAFHQGALFYRCEDAKRDIERMGIAARARIAMQLEDLTR